MMYGLDRLDGQPLSLRLIRDMHARLMEGNRGGDKNPGEFRRNQNWIGGTRPGNAMFVPVPPNELGPCLSDFEAFIHEEASGLPPLIKAGLSRPVRNHPPVSGRQWPDRASFDHALSLHERVAGGTPSVPQSLSEDASVGVLRALAVRSRNGRLGRVAGNLFLDGVAQTANQAFEAARCGIVELFKADRDRITADSDRVYPPCASTSGCSLEPFVTLKNQLVDKIGLSAPTVNAALAD